MCSLCKNHLEASEKHGKITIKVILRELENSWSNDVLYKLTVIQLLKQLLFKEPEPSSAYSQEPTSTNSVCNIFYQSGFHNKKFLALCPAPKLEGSYGKRLRASYEWRYLAHWFVSLCVYIWFVHRFTCPIALEGGGGESVK
jgi:hypothetical protein